VKIAVCIRRVADTAEADVKVNDTGKGIVEDRLVFTINEADNYALEEALLLKEKQGAEVVLVTVGPKESEEVLRMGLAKGADQAVRIDDSGLAGQDAVALARVLAAQLKDKGFDLILAGCIATGVEDSQVGPALAQLLGLPHAAYTIKLEPAGDRLVVKRELEGGLLDVKETVLPCVLSIQTGGNTPRYASILGIKRARSKPLETLEAAGLGLDAGLVGEAGSKTALLRLYAPESAGAAEMIEGDTAEKVARLAEIIRDRGLA